MALYVWTRVSTEEKDVKVRRKREIIESDDEEAIDSKESMEEEKKGEGGEGEAPVERRTRTRIVEETVTERMSVVVTRVHSSVSGLSGDIAGPVVYFLRSSDGLLGEAEAEGGALEFGVMQGGEDLLGSLHGVLRNVFVPLLEPQLRPKGTLHHHHSKLGVDGEGKSGSIIDGGTETGGGGDGHSTVSGTGGGGHTTERSVSGVSTQGSKVTSGKPSASEHDAVGVRERAPTWAATPQHTTLPIPAAEDASTAVLSDAVRSEFRSSLSRFSSVLSHTLIQVAGGGVRLSLPENFSSFRTPMDSAATAHDEALRGELVEVMDNWTGCILEACQPPTEEAKGARPLTEVECWRTRSATLSQLVEQTASPLISSIVSALEGAGEVVVEPFKAACAVLGNANLEALDNVKFLSTLERHFKTLTNGSLASITEGLPSLLNGLRVVWLISKGYNTDLTMLPLLKRIAAEICERVVAEVGALSHVLSPRNQPSEVLSMLSTSRILLESWKEIYTATRERIENSGTEFRWDFDKRALLERGDYMTSVLRDLEHVVETVAQLTNFYSGPELRALSADSSELEAILVIVAGLTAPLCRIRYSIWEKVRSTRWRNEMKAFDVKVVGVEEKTQAFISSSFDQLKSAESAFDVLVKLSTIRMRDSLRSLLHSNATNVVIKARQELRDVSALFTERKASPPVPKNAPPVAGAIAWANALYQRQKRPILRIKTYLPELFNTSEGQSLRAEYLSFAREVDAYVKALYAGWCELAKRKTVELLTSAILGPALLPTPLSPREIHAMVAASSPPPSMQIPSGGASGAGAIMHAMACSAASAAVALTNPAGGLLDSSGGGLGVGEPLLPLLPPPPYSVNFSPELYTIICESKLLDSMGYPLPEVAMAVSLAEGTLSTHVARLQSMLDAYHATLATLTPVEANMFQVHLVRVRKALRPGFSPLNWNSLHIDTFVQGVLVSLQELNSTLDQVRKSAAMLEEFTEACSSTSLVSIAQFSGRSDLNIGVIYAELQKYRQDALRVLQGRYAAIRPIMLQVESLIAGTGTCANPRLAEFYRYWERRVYNALVKMVLQSLCSARVLFNLVKEPQTLGAGMVSGALFNKLQGGGGRTTTTTTSSSDKQQQQQPTREPLVHVRAMFNLAVNPPEVQYSPDAAGMTVINYMSNLFKSLIESVHDFKRWMDGTCLPVELSPLAPGEAPPDFSFTREINRNPRILDAYLEPKVILSQSVLDIKKHISQFWGGADGLGVRAPTLLWAPRRNDADRRMVEHPPPASYFDERMTRYQRLLDSLGDLPENCDIIFLRVDCSALKASVRSQALKCKTAEAKVLRDIASRALADMKGKMLELRAGMDVQPTDLNSLKAVLGIVAQVKEKRCEMQVLIGDVRDRFATLALHGFAAPPPQGSGAASSSDTATTAAGGVGSEELFSVYEEACQAERLNEELQDLYDYSLSKNARLVKIKEKFREVTRTDALAFVAECDALHKEFFTGGPTGTGCTLAAGAAMLAQFTQRMAEAGKRRETFSAAERLFDLPVTMYTQLGLVKEAMNVVAPLYSLYQEKQVFVEGNSVTPWSELDMASLTRGSDEMGKKLAKFRDLKSHPIYVLLADDITALKESLPLISSLKNPAMKERHWDDIAKLTSIKIPPVKSLTLGAIFAMDLSRFSEGVEDICTQAKGELKIEKDLKAITEKWMATSFSVVPYKKGGEVRGMLLRPDETLRQYLDDDLMNLAAISGSRFVPIFAVAVGEWDKKLNLVSECVEVWTATQTKWAYLEGIFIGSEDIKQQLPEETKRFALIDKEFKTIMASTQKSPNVVEACCEAGRFQLLGMLGERLDGCQKSLSEYLYSKRNLFPRFFFVSDDELLSVLGSSDPNSIQVHLLKLFDNVKSFSIKTITTQAGTKLAVCEMGSSEGESYVLRTPSLVEGPVEAWMGAAEAAMKESLRLITKEGLFRYASTPRTAWIAEVLGMVAVCGSQTWWTWETEDTFRRVRSGDKYAMKLYAERQTKQLMDLVDKVRQNIGKQERIKVNTLLIVDIHARDIIDSFVRDSVLDAREFAWESQLRFYWDRGVDDVQIKQCTGVLRYGYEYMGLNGRLVITPLTDRCYMTLTQALTFNLGGAPAGPAGTGKTETTKDLAKNLAIPCFVTNCEYSQPSPPPRAPTQRTHSHTNTHHLPITHTHTHTQQVARVLTTKPWGPFLAGSHRQGPGAALTSSIASILRFSPWWPPRFGPFKMP